MGLLFTVGGARGTFEATVAEEVAGLIDQSFGMEGGWDGPEHRAFGQVDGAGWAELQAKAVAALGGDFVPNLLALGESGRGVFLPANLTAVALPLSVGTLQCASLTGLRRELFELAEAAELPTDEDVLAAIVREEDEGAVADPPEVRAFARLMLAANEAMRRDCPLWLVG
jgi:hypothetical protein